MKTFFVLSALFAASLAAPQFLIAPELIATSPLVSQYHTQDSLGQYAYGYNGLTSSKVEEKSLDGVTRGSYSYVDGEGKLQTVEYSADALNGFRVAATNLPKAPEVPKVELPIAPIDDKMAPLPVMDTPEVEMAKAEHLALVEAEKMRTGPVDIKVEPLEPVKDTPEVEMAKAEHLALVEAEKMRTGPVEMKVELLEPVKDTPEVAFAKAEHLRMVEEEKLRGTILPEIAVSRIAPIVPIAPIAPVLPIRPVAPIYPAIHSSISPYFARTIHSSAFPFATLESPLIARTLLHDNVAPIAPYDGSPIPFSPFVSRILL